MGIGNVVLDCGWCDVETKKILKELTGFEANKMI